MHVFWIPEWVICTMCKINYIKTLHFGSYLLWSFKLLARNRLVCILVYFSTWRTNWGGRWTVRSDRMSILSFLHWKYNLSIGMRLIISANFWVDRRAWIFFFFLSLCIHRNTVIIRIFSVHTRITSTQIKILDYTIWIFKNTAIEVNFKFILAEYWIR